MAAQQAAILASPESTPTLAGHPAARDFVSDAFAHNKIVGYVSDTQPLLTAAGVPSTSSESRSGGDDDSDPYDLDPSASPALARPLPRNEPSEPPRYSSFSDG